LQQLQAGVAPGDTVIGGTLRNAAQALGGQATSFSQGAENGKVFIRAEVSYP